MSAQSRTAPTPHVLTARPGSPRTIEGPIMVATDGSDASLEAFEMARLLAGPHGTVDVFGVVEPAPAVMPPIEVPLYMPELDAARREGLLQRAREDARRMLGDVESHVDAVIGRPVEEIGNRARTIRAGIVITGLQHHGHRDRLLLRGDTPLGIARVARTPVLVVPVRVSHLPRIVLVATDLDETSVNAARMARPLLDEATHVYVVHVRRLGMAPADPSWEHVQARLTTDHLARMVAALDLPTEVHVDTRTLTGHPVAELLDFAEEVGAELIVAGYRKRLLLDRLTGPRSIAERVYRGTPCAMLLVPETAVRTAADEVASRTNVFAARGDMAAQLAAFAQRNAGRSAHLEIDTAELGSQAQVVGFPLSGVDYEPPTDTVHVMFGDAATGMQHLAHSIRHPQAVEVQHAPDGADLSLRIAHTGGYSLLTFAEPERKRHE